MTPDHPDTWLKRRGPAADILDMNDRRPLPVHGAPTLTERDLQEPAAPPPEPRNLTDLEQIALWVVYLTYADMKALAAGVLSKDAEATAVIDLADKFHAWATAMRPAT